MKMRAARQRSAPAGLASLRRRVQIALAALLLAPAALAHNFHMGMADISFNATTGSTEIVHTYSAHDIDSLMANLYEQGVDLTRPEGERLLRHYIERQFYVLGAERRRLPLHWVGLQASGDSVIVYQEIEKMRLAPGTRIHQDVLSDFIGEQKNTVNLREGGAVQTLLFERGRAEQAIP